MNPLRNIMALALIAATASGVSAQDAAGNLTQENNGVPERAIILSGGQNGINREVLAVLYDTSELHFQDPDAPRFLFIDRKGNTVFGIGGYIEGILQYDFDGAIDNAGFDTYEIPVPADPSLRNRLGADASRSTIVLQLLHHTKLGVLSAYIQGNFSGSGKAFSLKQAYVKLHNVTFGLTRSTFQDAMAGVPTIDYTGPAGAISIKNYLLQYKVSLTDHWSTAISAEMPDAQYTTLSGANKAINQRFPDLPAYIQYQWDGGKSHIRASAIFRDLSYRNLVTGENRFHTGWGVQLSGGVKLCDYATVYYQASYGKGIARYSNNIAKEGFDLIYDGTDGEMMAPASFGFVGGARFNLTKNLFVSANYSLSRLYDQEQLAADAYRRGNCFVTNLFYSPISDMQLGVEYLHGIRTDMRHMQGSANRIEAMVKYSF